MKVPQVKVTGQAGDVPTWMAGPTSSAVAGLTSTANDGPDDVSVIPQ